MKIASERPYPVTRLSTSKWQALDPRWVYFHQLTTTQDGVKLEALIHGSESVSGDTYPHVVVWEGRHYLEDGHTRVTRALLAGKDGLYCRVWSIEKQGSP